MVLKVKKNRALYETPSQSYGMLLAIWDNTVLPATRHKWTHRTLTPARGRYSIYLPQRDGRLSWPRWLVTYLDGLVPSRYLDRWPQAVTYLSTNPSVLGWQSNSQPVDHKSDALTTTLANGDELWAAHDVVITAEGDSKAFGVMMGGWGHYIITLTLTF